MHLTAKRGIMETKVTQRVHLEFVAPDAREVFVAGSFNDWHPSVAPMIPLGNGKWAKELMLAPGRYEYRFVVDGQWTDDVTAREWIPNPFGSANAILEVVATAQAKAAPAKVNVGRAVRNSPSARASALPVPVTGRASRKSKSNFLS